MTKITVANLADAESITALLNGAYRGEASKQGWTTEAELISGSVRATEEMVRELIGQPGSVLLKHTDENARITGCVNLQKQATKLYLGMLSVSPILQGKGVGKQLLLAAEQYAKQQNCETIRMSVISVRTELVDWYMRRGYLPSGETKPFPEDERLGTPTRPLEFMILEKKV
jgi:ribosomal protein S18 acetylase RimI-like enzyme